MRSFKDLLSTKTEEYKNKFDSSKLAKQFIPYYENQKRIEVRFSTGEIKRGTVSVTTGWKPSFLLMLRIDSTGSSWLLSKQDIIIREIN